MAHLTNAFGFLRLIGGLFKMRRYLQGRLQVAREEGGEGLIAELVRVEQEGGRIGATVSLPVNRHHSVKLYAIRGFNAYREADLDLIGVAWQYRWGGGY